MSKFYDDKYGAEESYWGKQPSSIARLFFHKYLPEENQKLMDIGCGEGRDSIFFARNGYLVTGFDSSNIGLEKAQAWADELRLSIEFFQADINEYRLEEFYDVIYSSGALHYIPIAQREIILSNYKHFTNAGGLHAHTVPVHKPFITTVPQADDRELIWRSGEILTYYYDWKVEYFSEEIQIDVKSGYKFPVNKLIVREPSG